MDPSKILTKNGHLTDKGLIWVNQYLKGKLTGNELRQFEKIMKENEPFAHEVKLIHAMNSMILEKKLRQLESSHLLDQQTPIIKLIVKKYLVAASISLLIIGSLLFVVYRSTNNSNLLVDQYFQPYALSLSYHRGEHDSLKLQYNKALLAYQQKDFKQASVLFLEVIEQGMDDQRILFYLGNAYLAIENYTGAIEQLELLSRQVEGEYVARSHWYLALAYLGHNHLENAKLELQKIIETNTYKKSEAKELLKELMSQ